MRPAAHPSPGQGRRAHIQDENGSVARISTYDVNQSNGVIHVIDRVVMPS